MMRLKINYFSLYSWSLSFRGNEVSNFFTEEKGRILHLECLEWEYRIFHEHRQSCVEISKFNCISNYTLIIQILSELTKNDNAYFNISPRRNVNSLLIFSDLKIFNKYLEVSQNKIIVFEKNFTFQIDKKYVFTLDIPLRLYMLQTS